MHGFIRQKCFIVVIFHDSYKILDFCKYFRLTFGKKINININYDNKIMLNLVRKFRYTISMDKKKKKKNWRSFTA